MEKREVTEKQRAALEEIAASKGLIPEVVDHMVNGSMLANVALFGEEGGWPNTMRQAAERRYTSAQPVQR